MLNVNGQFMTSENDHFTNRSFLFADALFDTLLFKNEKIVFAEDHYFRLLAGMRQLRMNIPTFFTYDFWQKEILKTLNANQLKFARVRTTIYRDSKGFYTPASHEIGFVIQVNPLDEMLYPTYELGLYKDNFLNCNTLNNIKTTNRLINVLASIYAKENKLENCVLLNHKKQVASAINANLFAVYGDTIKTPALTEGCVQGIIRQKVIDIIANISDFKLIETSLNFIELQNADEVFLTNSIMGIQAVSVIRKQHYNKEIATYLHSKLENLY